MEHADRLAFLVDGADYFRAFREAAKQARHSLLIIGWDVDSGVALVREHKPGDGVHGAHDIHGAHGAHGDIKSQTDCP